MHVNPLRCMRGTYLTGAPTHTAEIALFNQSTGAYLLRVLFAAIGNDGSSGLNGFFVTKQRLTNQGVGVVTPIVTDQPPLAGLIDADDVATPGTLDFGIFANSGNFNYLNARYPLAVLLPGWSLVAVSDTAGQPFNVSFLWEQIDPEDLYNPSAGDSENLP